MNGLVEYGSCSSEADSETEDAAPIVLDEQKSSATLLSALPNPIMLPMSSGTGVIPGGPSRVENDLEDIVQRKQWERQEAPKPPRPKRLRRAVKIDLPELPESDSDDDADSYPSQSHAKQTSKAKGASGLLSALPAPINKAGARLMLPNIVRNQTAEGKKHIKKAGGTFSKNTAAKTVENPSSSLGAKPVNPRGLSGPLAPGGTTSSRGDSDLSSEDEQEASDDRPAAGTSFFNLNEDPDIPPLPTDSIETTVVAESSDVYSQPHQEIGSTSKTTTVFPPERIPIEPAAGQSSNISLQGSSHWDSHVEDPCTTTSPSAIPDLPETSGALNVADLPPELLAQVGQDKKALAELSSSGGMILNVSTDSVLGNVRENLLKNITEEQSSGLQDLRRRVKDGVQPTSVQRRKHQITYLAHLAKEKEIQLQQEWANNRQTKRQTQSKYGFV